jgi:NAD(P)-dependent dehydrogenase (short-subunit alcohol dehydrogenase family)
MRTIVITGATGAVGLEASRALAEKGNHLVLVGRNEQALTGLSSKLNVAGSKADVVLADLGDMESVRNAVAKIRKDHPRIHGIVNIAALYKSALSRTAQKNETMFATNHLGPFLLTTGLMNELKSTPGSKVLTVSAPSSTKINFDNLNSDKKFSALNVFGGTKMMNLLFAFALARGFEGTPHASMAFHPGLVKSSLLKEAPAFLRWLLGMISSKATATGKAIAELMTTGDASSQNGKFYNNAFREMKAAPHAYDAVIQQMLWEKSVELVAG